jgi:hypothetical protein
MTAALLPGLREEVEVEVEGGARVEKARLV